MSWLDLWDFFGLPEYSELVVFFCLTVSFWLSSDLITLRCGRSRRSSQASLSPRPLQSLNAHHPSLLA